MRLCAHFSNRQTQKELGMGLQSFSMIPSSFSAFSALHKSSDKADKRGKKNATEIYKIVDCGHGLFNLAVSTFKST